jgi:hypothetical protein
MIGIDTNILLRLWLNDDPAHDKRIDALLAEHGRMPGRCGVESEAAFSVVVLA